MSNNIRFACKVNNSDPTAALGIEILLDGQSMYKNPHVSQICDVEFEINDDEAQRRLEFKMTGKTQQHTKIDDEGNIVADALLTLSAVSIDDIELDEFMSAVGQYHHDFNGTQSPVVDKFYGNMGCNGIVKFEFTTPIYLWLLENL